jgi:hypothetical protein
MKNFAVYLLPLLLTLLALGFWDGCKLRDSSGSWNIAIVDSNGNVGEYCSIAVDGNGNAHIAYFDHLNDEQIGADTVPYGNLKYAGNANGAWETATLDTGAGLTPRIFVDSNDQVHIVHTKLDASDLLKFLDLKYTTNSYGSWETVTINTQVVKGDDASIAVDSDGNVHISLRNEEGVGTREEGSDGGLRYVTDVTGQWTWVDVDTSPTAGNDTDIAVDRYGAVHISYLDKSGGLRYSTNASGAWEVYTIDDAANVGWNTSIAVDSNGGVHISYSDPSPVLNPPGNGCLKYATNASGAWTTEIVDDEDAGFYTGIAADSEDNLHIAYYTWDSTAGSLRYATNASGSWVKEAVDETGVVGLFCAIAVDTTGSLHISYYDYTGENLEYAKRRQ